MPEYTHDNALHRANLDNLTSLWQCMGVETANSDAIGLSRSRSWPNRAWFAPDREIGPDGELQRVIRGQRPGTLFPVWRYGSEYPSPWHKALLSEGLTLQSELTAMCLTGYRLSLQEDSGLLVQEVTCGWEIDAWSELCGRCFGYQIDSAVIGRIAQDERVQVLWARVNDVPVATALLYASKTAVGVHQVGVDPDWRGRGLAHQLMRAISNRAIMRWQPSALVLQASNDGLEIYRRQGFVEQFRIGLFTRPAG